MAPRPQAQMLLAVAAVLAVVLVAPGDAAVARSIVLQGLTNATRLLVSPPPGTGAPTLPRVVVVGDGGHLRRVGLLATGAAASPVTAVPLDVPRPCTPSTSSGNWGQAATAPCDAPCRAAYARSNCGGNIYYDLHRAPDGSGDVWACSAVGQCERHALADLSRLGPRASRIVPAYPDGWFCGPTGQQPNALSLRFIQTTTEWQRYCPIFTHTASFEKAPAFQFPRTARIAFRGAGFGQAVLLGPLQQSSLERGNEQGLTPSPVEENAVHVLTVVNVADFSPVSVTASGLIESKETYRRRSENDHQIAILRGFDHPSTPTFLALSCGNVDNCTMRESRLVVQSGTSPIQCGTFPNSLVVDMRRIGPAASVLAAAVAGLTTEPSFLLGSSATQGALCIRPDAFSRVGTADIPVALPALLAGSRLTRMALDITHGHTVATIVAQPATGPPQLVRVHITNINAAGATGEAEVLIPTLPATPLQLEVDGTDGAVMMLWPDAVERVAPEDCARHTTCGACIQSRDPYCGWCAIEGLCTQRATCPQAAVLTRSAPSSDPLWLQDVSATDASLCPGLLTAQPDDLHIGETATVVFAAASVPAPPAGNVYFCSLGAYGTFPATYTPAQAAAGPTISCSITVPALQDPQAHDDPTVVGLTLGLTAGTATPFALDASVEFSPYNCAPQANSCLQCTGGQHACGFCLFDGSCTLRATQCSAAANFLAAGTCPAVQSLTPGLLHVNTAGASVAVSGARFPADPTGTSYTCQFSPADGLAAASASAVRASASSVSCGVPVDDGQSPLFRSGSLPRNVTVMLAGVPVDGDVSIEFYDCAEKGGGAASGECSRCVSQGNARFGCGWCRDGNPSLHICSLQSACTDWIPIAPDAINSCPSPELLDLDLRSGPSVGGTTLTILGENLGRDINDIADLTVAGRPCALQSYDVVTGTIVCLTSAAPAAVSGPVTIRLTSGQTDTSSFQFAYVEPQITALSPDRAPLAGGSRLTITGTFLDVGNRLEVTADNRVCADLSRSATRVICTIQSPPPARRRRRQTGQLCVMLDAGIAARTCTPASGSGPPPAFTIVPNPAVASVDPLISPAAGGVVLTVTGTNMDAALAPEVNTVGGAASARRFCTVVSSTTLSCPAPAVPAAGVGSSGSTRGLAFTMDLATTSLAGALTYFPDPLVTAISPVLGSVGERIEISGSSFLLAGEPVVRIGGVVAPLQNPRLDGFMFVLVPDPDPGVDVHTITVSLGDAEYSHAEPFEYRLEAAASGVSSAAAGAAGGIVGLLVLVVVVLFVLQHINRRKKKVAEEQLVKQMNDLEAQVADVCKQGFAELQAVTTLNLSDKELEIRDFDSLAQSVLFTYKDTHPPPAQSSGAAASAEEELLEGFDKLLADEHFCSTLVATLEAQGKAFTVRDRCHVAALLAVALQHQGAFSFTVLKALLDDVVDKGRKNPKLMLRRTETVAEKFLTCWLTVGMYDFLKHTAGLPLFKLFQALRLQIEKGPVDACTGASMYTLNADYLLRERFTFEAVEIAVEATDDGEMKTVKVQVNSCDTMRQCKIKLLEAMHNGLGYSRQRSPDSFELVEKGWPTAGRVLRDQDTTSFDGSFIRLRTLASYGVKSGAVLIIADSDIVAKQPMKKKRSRSRLPPPGTEKMHLILPHSQTAGESKIPSEIFLTYLMTVKGTIQPYVDELLDAVFGVADCPPPVKALFDYLDTKAREIGVSDDADVLHIWKNNALPLRFWINIIKNPEFVYDIDKTPTINSSLSTIAQVVMDSCSVSKQQLGKHSPTNKHLYRAEVALYKDKVSSFYQAVSSQPAVTDARLNACYAEQDGTVSSKGAAKRELLQYAADIREPLLAALLKKGHNAMADDFARAATYFDAWRQQNSRRDDKSMDDDEMGYLSVNDDDDQTVGTTLDTSIFESKRLGHNLQYHVTKRHNSRPGIVVNPLADGSAEAYLQPLTLGLQDERGVIVRSTSTSETSYLAPVVKPPGVTIPNEYAEVEETPEYEDPDENTTFGFGDEAESRPTSSIFYNAIGPEDDCSGYQMPETDF